MLMPLNWIPALRNYTPSQMNRLAATYPVIIPVGAVVEATNFAQLEPDTPGIIAGGPATLKGCNLTNVRLPANFAIEDCNTAHVERRKVGNKIEHWFRGNKQTGLIPPVKHAEHDDI